MWLVHCAEKPNFTSHEFLQLDTFLRGGGRSLRFEQLENRSLLSTFAVLNTDDSGEKNPNCWEQGPAEVDSKTSWKKDKLVREYDFSGKEKRTFGGHKDWIYSLAIDSAHRRLATGAFDGEVRLWDADSTLCTGCAQHVLLSALPEVARIA